ENVCDELSQRASAISDPFRPWEAADAKRLDRLSLQDWLGSLKCSELCKLSMRTMMETDNGVSVENQSLLANLAMVQGGGGKGYWEQTEVYRCAGGNQQLAYKLAAPLSDRIFLAQ